MAHHRWHKQNDNYSRDQPDGADHQIARKRQVNSSDGEQRKDRLPPRLGFINVI
jgi:hypothetical protein